MTTQTFMMKTDSLFDPNRMNSLDASQVGRIGEHLVAAMLAGYGHEVHHTAGNGYDLLVMLPDTSDTIRVDVKTKKAATNARRFNIKKGKTTTFREYEAGICDVFALVCLEDTSVTFEKCDDYVGKSGIYLNGRTHRGTCPYSAWKECIQ